MVTHQTAIDTDIQTLPLGVRKASGPPHPTGSNYLSSPRSGPRVPHLTVLYPDEFFAGMILSAMAKDCFISCQPTPKVGRQRTVYLPYFYYNYQHRLHDTESRLSLSRAPHYPEMLYWERLYPCLLVSASSHTNYL